MDKLEEYRIFGPPGTGKTSSLIVNIAEAARIFGGNNIIVSSFTKAAAVELISRIGDKEIDINEKQVGTLHAHGYRSIGGESAGEVAESRKWLKAWNEEFGYLYKLSGEIDADEGAFDLSDGDDTLVKYHNYRQRMIDRKFWNTSVQAFAQKWEEWKEKNHLIDYTDMIEIPLRSVDKSPGEPAVGIFDEVQDFTPLELALVRKWGKEMKKIILAGDDDQSIYAFKGASPEAFLNPPVDNNHKRVLGQSYRLPRAVQKFSQEWINLIKVREPKEFKPRDEEGEVRTLSLGSIKTPEYVIRDMERYLIQGKSIMILVTCSYMLEQVKKVLYAEGIPFHNPYRRKRVDWNPLHFYAEKTSAAQRLLAFLKPSLDVFEGESRQWTWAEVAKFSKLLKADGVFKRGQKKYVEFMRKNTGTAEVSDLIKVFEPAALENIMDCNIDWLRNHLMEADKKRLAYPLSILKSSGVEKLQAQPQVIISTIHAVKGGEADVVYLFPDLSYQGYQEYEHHATRDSTIRQFYVGITRARESLIICEPATQFYVRLRSYIPKSVAVSV